MQNTVCSSLDKVTDIQAGRHAEGFNHKQLNYSMYVASYVSQYSRAFLVNAIITSHTQLNSMYVASYVSQYSRVNAIV